LFPKILPEICFLKLVPEAAPEWLSTIPKLVPNVVLKNAPEINFPKLFKIATKNYSPKFLVNTSRKLLFFEANKKKKIFKIILKIIHGQ
jgi:hypothetical protein